TLLRRRGEGRLTVLKPPSLRTCSGLANRSSGCGPRRCLGAHSRALRERYFFCSATCATFVPPVSAASARGWAEWRLAVSRTELRLQRPTRPHWGAQPRLDPGVEILFAVDRTSAPISELRPFAGHCQVCEEEVPGSYAVLAQVGRGLLAGQVFHVASQKCGQVRPDGGRLCRKCY